MVIYAIQRKHSNNNGVNSRLYLVNTSEGSTTTPGQFISW